MDVSLDIDFVDMDVDINTEPSSYLLGIQKTNRVKTCTRPPPPQSTDNGSLY